MRPKRQLMRTQRPDAIRWQTWHIAQALRTLRIASAPLRQAIRQGAAIGPVLRHLAMPRISALHPDHFRGYHTTPGSVSHAQQFKGAWRAYGRLRRLSVADWERWDRATQTVPTLELPLAYGWDGAQRRQPLGYGWQESREHLAWQEG